MGISKQGLFEPCSVKAGPGIVKLSRRPVGRRAGAKVGADSTFVGAGACSNQGLEDSLMRPLGAINGG